MPSIGIIFRYALKRKTGIGVRGTDLTSSEGNSDRSEKSGSQISFDSVEEQRDIDEINRILDIELPEVVTDESSATFAEAKRKMESKVSEMFEFETQCIASLKKECILNNIPLEMIALDYVFSDRTLRNIFYIIDPIKNRNKSFFEQCHDLETDLAEHLLSDSYFFLSRFGRLCPVQYQDYLNPFLMYERSSAANEVFPVLHRNYVYFIHGSQNLEKFKKDPLKYVNTENIEFPFVRFNLAITGPPKSGKSTLAMKLCHKLGLKVITRGRAVRYVLSELPFSSLARKMRNALKKGYELSDEMVMKSVEAASLDGDSAIEGINL